MARKTIFVSDLSGKPVEEKDAATVTIRYADARRGIVVLDAGHFIPDEQPEAIAAAIADFITDDD